MTALLLMPPHGPAAGAAPKSKPHATVASVKRAVAKNAESVQLVTFPDTEWHPVKVIRGGTPANPANAGNQPAERAETAEIVSFGDPNGKPVRVVRGETAGAAVCRESRRARAAGTANWSPSPTLARSR